MKWARSLARVSAETTDGDLPWIRAGKVGENLTLSREWQRESLPFPQRATKWTRGNIETVRLTKARLLSQCPQPHSRVTQNGHEQKVTDTAVESEFLISC